MSKLATISIDEVIEALPESVDAESEPYSPYSGIDAFIAVLGFEPRSLAAARLLSRGPYRAKLGLRLEYGTNECENRQNLEELESLMNLVCDTVKPLPADQATFIELLQAEIQRVIDGGNGQPVRVTLDISVAANRLILRCMQVLMDLNIDLRVLYTEPITYYPTYSEVLNQVKPHRGEEIGNLEMGVGNVVTSREHPGLHFDPMPDAVVIFPSFDVARCKAVIANVDPVLLHEPDKKVFWLFGKPRKEDEWRLAATVERVAPHSESVRYTVSTFRYKESLRVLEEIFEKSWSKWKLTVAPIGSKMQALSAAMFSYIHPEIRFKLTIPKEYNSRRSDGVKTVWLLDFGDTLLLRNRLDSVGTIMVKE